MRRRASCGGSPSNNPSRPRFPPADLDGARVAFLAGRAQDTSYGGARQSDLRGTAPTVLPRPMLADAALLDAALLLNILMLFTMVAVQLLPQLYFAIKNRFYLPQVLK